MLASQYVGLPIAACVPMLSHRSIQSLSHLQAAILMDQVVVQSAPTD